MVSEIFGWTGKILKVDLSDNRITELYTMKYADRFLGGRGIATKIFWDEVKPGVKAFDPENYLILMNGPLGATGAQGASRFIVAGKSPMSVPEQFCYGNLGGFFGPFLKKADYDGVAITGWSEKPCMILIKDGKTEIREASQLWGKGCFEVERLIKEEYGQGARFVTTGPAGENKVRSATLNTDNEGVATGGFGAVMGSKNLKAVVVLGSGKPAVARPDKLSELVKESIRLNEQGREVPGMAGVENLGTASCYQCGFKCIRNRYKSPSGKESVRKCQAMTVYMSWAARRTDESMETVMDATEICNDLSICTMELANMLRWIYVAHKAGDLKEKETGISISDIGTRAFFENLVSMVAYREGLGDTLAEGLLRAGEHLGEWARSHFTSTIGGVGGGSGYSPREYIINTMLYTLEPRQPIAMLHEISRLVIQWAAYHNNPESNFVSSEVFRKAALKFWGNDTAWDMTTPEGKAEASARIFDRSLAKDSLVLCDFSWPVMVSKNTPDNVGDPTLESRLFSAVTGIETDEKGLRGYGERIFNLQRAILLRDGWRPMKDDEPAAYNFTEPIMKDLMNPGLIVPGPGEEAISVKGRILDRRDFEKIRSEFFEIRGWDKETGLQKAETLYRLDLVDVADGLKGYGLVG